MRLIIAGSRTITDYDTVLEAFVEAVNKLGWMPDEIVSGCASGVDTVAIDLASILNIPVKKFPADWKTHGKSGGYVRNMAMGKYADAAVVVWDGKSRGSKMMLNIMALLGVMYLMFIIQAI